MILAVIYVANVLSVDYLITIWYMLIEYMLKEMHDQARIAVLEDWVYKNVDNNARNQSTPRMANLVHSTCFV
ncbi:hypothetical protein L1987_80306 [Smallanthus sonchifolius]|uniref:Uncharacterized protein n=1 Tax=Smallanthus sonchifolius TaxID=185202 RepID=A0ACB8YMY3_9ASTR|nr:hypothetical protein L1987_80306 [Smallanthus sonchifolius]